MSNAAKPFAIGGVGAQVSLDDLVRIAQGQVTLALDPGEFRAAGMAGTPGSMVG